MKPRRSRTWVGGGVLIALGWLVTGVAACDDASADPVADGSSAPDAAPSGDGGSSGDAATPRPDGTTGADLPGSTDAGADSGSVTCATDCSELDGPCIEGVCTNGTCATSPLTGGACDDGDACTDNDICDAGVCQPGTAKVCDDNNPCTDDSCAEGACVATNTTASCDDGDACTEGDICGDGSCQPGTPKACDDGNACTNDACEGGNCVATANSAPCDDGDACTSDDFCQDSGCTGNPIVGNGCNEDGLPSDVSSCYAGALSQAEKDAALDHVNFIRGLHGLAPVTYAPEADVKAQEAALMMAANSDLDHTPPQSWHCWTQAGSDGAGDANLHIAWSFSGSSMSPPADVITGWLIDDNVTSLGHRRWIIDPFLAKIAYGAVKGEPLASSQYPYAQGSTLIVQHSEQQDLSNSAVEYIAYPVGDYPAYLVDTDWYLSFSVLANKNSWWQNKNVDFSNASVTVTGPDGAMTVTNVADDNTGYGMPNALQWRVPDLHTDVEYTVDITGVGGTAPQSAYSYTFRLVP